MIKVALSRMAVRACMRQPMSNDDVCFYIMLATALFLTVAFTCILCWD